MPEFTVRLTSTVLLTAEQVAREVQESLDHNQLYYYEVGMVIPGDGKQR